MTAPRANTLFAYDADSLPLVSLWLRDPAQAADYDNVAFGRTTIDTPSERIEFLIDNVSALWLHRRALSVVAAPWPSADSERMSISAFQPADDADSFDEFIARWRDTNHVARVRSPSAGDADAESQ